jgi:hypothetical protein
MRKKKLKKGMCKGWGKSHSRAAVAKKRAKAAQ